MSLWLWRVDLGEELWGDRGDAVGLVVELLVLRSPVAGCPVAMELGISGHALARLLDLLVLKSDCFGDGFRSRSGVLTEVPEDRRAGLVTGVITSGSVE